MQRTGYQSLDSRSTWSLTQVLAIGALVAVSAVATGAAVSSSSSTALYAPAAVRATNAQAFATVPVTRAGVYARGVEASVIQAAGIEEVAVPVAPVQSLVQMLLIPVAAVATGLAAYLWKSQSQAQSWAMAATSGEETDIKPYKSNDRATSYYGKPAGVTEKQNNPMEHNYKPPVGGYSAQSTKTYTPTTETAKSYISQAQGATPSFIQYKAPASGYSATNGKTYKPTTSKADSYFGKDQGAVAPVKGAMWYGPDRPKWLGPLSTPKSTPDWLKGTLAGDYGFDPLGLGSDATKLARYQEAELMNGRWAMLGALGCFWPEFCAKYYGYNVAEPVWYKAGGAIFNNADGLDFEKGSGFVHSIFSTANTGATLPINPVLILVCEIVFMGLVEGFRASRITGRDGLYPGKFFDPLGLANDPNDFAELKVKEIKNGRLAMLAMLGFFAQAALTHQGPVENLAAHLADPTHAVIFAPVA